jgi:glycosyltransferase A (GT-A) superfamily protein (DUF2064 family)
MTELPAVAVMAKVPGATAVKSRLHPVLGASLATRLYECFLRDRLEALTTVGAIARVVAFTPPEAREAMAEVAPAGFTLLPQSGDDLGARLDSDSPTLPMGYVAEAARALATSAADVVVGPCDDGGYYLIGTRQPHPELFAAMPWSTDRVLPLTLERARGHGLRTHVLPTWFDVDTEADLVRLRDALTTPLAAASRTSAFIREMGAAGVLDRPAANHPLTGGGLGASGNV